MPRVNMGWILPVRARSFFPLKEKTLKEIGHLPSEHLRLIMKIS